MCCHSSDAVCSSFHYSTPSSSFGSAFFMLWYCTAGDSVLLKIAHFCDAAAKFLVVVIIIPFLRKYLEFTSKTNSSLSSPTSLSWRKSLCYALDSVRILISLSLFIQEFLGMSLRLWWRFHCFLFSSVKHFFILLQTLPSNMTLPSSSSIWSLLPFSCNSSLLYYSWFKQNFCDTWYTQSFSWLPLFLQFLHNICVSCRENVILFLVMELNVCDEEVEEEAQGNSHQIPKKSFESWSNTTERFSSQMMWSPFYI